MYVLKDKVAIITGGAQGIGLSVAKEILHHDVKGVALLDVDQKSGSAAVEELSREFSTARVIYICTDVSQRCQFEEAFKQTIQAFSRIDIIINNAGIFNELVWEKCIGVNLQGCITGSLLALDKYFPKQPEPFEGIILNVSSVWALYPYEYAPVYLATKEAILGFSRCISGPNRRRHLNVKVISICPGLTKTAIFNATSEQVDKEFLEVGREQINAYPSQSSSEVA